MDYLVATVVLLGVIGLVNLLLTVGILRRMRATPVWQPEPLFALGPGSAVGEFSAVTTTDEPVSNDTLAGMVGFFSAGCLECHDLLPLFAAGAGEMEREKVLAVVGGGDEEMVRALAPVARVVVADLGGGPVARAFQNSWTPALYLVGDDHRVVAVGTRMEELPIGTRVRG
jgi:hypothetical protein